MVVTAEDGNTTETYTIHVERGVDTDFGWKAADDLNGLYAAGNGSPNGIWSNGSTMWVTDTNDFKLYAYTLSGGTRQDGAGSTTNLEINLHSGNNVPRGLWSNGTTVWVADWSDGKLYAYALAGGARQTSLEFNLHSANRAPQSIWSNGTTIWVTDTDADKLYAYALSGGARQDGTGSTTNLEFDLHADNSAPRGIWSDGQTIWVADGPLVGAKKMYAYKFTPGSDFGNRDSAKDFTLTSNNDDPRGIWSDGTTMWVTNIGSDEADKVFSYNMPALSTNNPPSFTSSASFSVVENTTAVGTVVATDDDTDDSIEGYALTGGADQAKFSITTGGVLTFAAAPDYENPGDAASTDPPNDAGNNEYIVEVTATSGTGDRELTTDQVITVTVTDVEPPAAPTITSALINTYTSISPIWNELADAASVTRYDLRHRLLGGSAWTEVTNVTTSTSLTTTVSTRGAILSGLQPGRTYEIQVRASNIEGTGPWSANHVTYTDSNEAYFDAASYEVVEGGSVEVTVRLAAAHGRATGNIALTATASGTGITGADYTAPASVSFSAAETSKTVTVSAPADAEVETDHAVTLGFGGSAPGGVTYTHGRQKTARVTIEDAVTITPRALTVTEQDANGGTYTVVLNSEPPGRVSVIISGHAGTDVRVNGSASNQLLTFETSNYSTAQTVTVTAVDDADTTDDDAVTLSHAVNGFGSVTDGGTVTVTVTDNDMATATDATLSALAVSEGTIHGFPGSRPFVVGVANSVTSIDVTPTANDSGATITVNTNAVTSGSAHTVSSLAVGRNTVTVVVTAEDGNTTETYTIYVERGVDTEFGWKAADDLNGLRSAGNAHPRGIWSNGTTMWVVDSADGKLYAYSLPDGTRQANMEFNLDVTSGSPRGIWSNGTTIWVIRSSSTDKLFAYALSGGARQTGLEFNLHADNDNPRGIWSDGTTVWVVDSFRDKLYAYTLTGSGRGTRQDGTGGTDNLEFDLHSDNGDPQGIWSDGETMWVADFGDRKIYAYKFAAGNDFGTRDSGKDFNTLDAAGNRKVQNLWSDGTTMWAVNNDSGILDKVFSYNMPPPSSDATLSALTLSQGTLHGFPDYRPFVVGVANSVTSIDVTPTATDAGATIAITVDSTTTAVTSGSAHTVSPLTENGRTTVTVLVTAADGNTTETYTIYVERGVDTDYGWKAADDLNGLYAAGNRRPAGIWSNGTTMWVVDGTDTYVYSYDSVGTRQDGTGGADDLEFDLAQLNRFPKGIWSDGETLWVTNDFGGFYAYALSDGTRQDGTGATTDLEFDWHTDNQHARGIWSDGTTMWVADLGDSKIYAYALSDGTRQTSMEFNLHADNDLGWSIWSDGETMWVGDARDNKIYAYKFTPGTDFGARDSSKDFSTLNGRQLQTRGLWSDGETMWAANYGGSELNKVFSYNMPDSSNADLKSLEISGVTLAFDPATTSYTGVGVDNSVDSATVTAVPRQNFASVAITTNPTSSDADAMADGYQLTNLPNNDTYTITVTVTAQDGNTSKVYTVELAFRDIPKLTGLTVNPGTLTPAFAADTTAYTVPDIGYATTRITINATAASGATVSFLDGADMALTDADSATGFQVDLDPGDNTVKVRATKGTATQDYTLTITRAKPTVSIVAGATTVDEGEGLTFTVSRGTAAADDLHVTLNVTETGGDMLAAGFEGEHTFTIEANRASVMGTLPTAGDDDWEEHSTVTVTVAAKDHYTVAAPPADAATVQVRDDDFPDATAELDVSPGSVTEGNPVTATLTITTDRDEQPHKDPGTVTFTTADGTGADAATAPADYATLSSAQAVAITDFTRVDIDGGVMRWRATKTAQITTVDDTVVENAETFTVSVATPTGIIAPSAQTVTIRTSDAPMDATAPTPMITLADSADGDEDFKLEISFGEAVTGFDKSDIGLNDDWLIESSATLTAEATAGDYSVPIVPSPDVAGLYVDLEVTIAAAAVMDTATPTANSSLAGTLELEDVFTGPATFIFQVDPADTDGEFEIEVYFLSDYISGRPVTGFDETKITVTNGTVSSFDPHPRRFGNNQSSGVFHYSAMITPNCSPPLPCEVKVDVARDAATSVDITQAYWEHLHGTGGSVDPRHTPRPNNAANTLIVKRESMGADPYVRALALYRDPNNFAYRASFLISEDYEGVYEDSLGTKTTRFAVTNALPQLIGDDEARLLWEFWLNVIADGNLTLKADMNRDGDFDDATVDYTYTITGALKTLPVPQRAARSKASQAVEIPDDALRAILGALLNKEAGDAITRADLATVVSLNLRDSGVADLGGLQHAVNLTELYLDDFSLDLAPLRGLGLDVHVPGEEPLRVPSNDATLSALELSGVDISAFASATTDYTASVAADVTETTVTATANDDKASYVVKLDGAEDADGTVALVVGANTVTIEVTAEDRNTAKTYRVTVTRAVAPLSNDATLSNLTLSGVNFGTFNPATTDYTAGVANDVFETTVTATSSDGGASYVVKLGGVEDADGTVALAVGDNTITIVVTAEDENTAKIYTVTVTRAVAPLSNDATLSNLTLSGANFGTFNPATTEYTASVGNDVTETTVTATANDNGATYVVRLGGVEDADGTVALAVGANAVSVVVTAQDGQTAKTYTVTVTRVEAAATTVPDVPDIPSGRLTGEGSVALDWSDVPTADSYDVMFWQVDTYVQLSEDAPVNGISITFDGSSATVTGLPTDYDWYYFIVRAVNDGGASDWSPNNAISAKPAAPNPPFGRSTGLGTVSLDWNDVTAATSYEVSFWQGGDYITLSADASVNGISITFNGSGAAVSGLPTDHDWYYFRVRAVNAAGASDWSDYGSVAAP